MLRKAAPWLLFVATIVVYIGLAYLSLFGFIDDAFISFRYAENLAHGHGLVYNLGERVEGYSNTLFVLLLALGVKFGLSIPTTAKALGVLFQAGTVALAAAFMQRRLNEPLSRPLPAMALAFLLFHPSEMAYTESGMETTMAAFLLLLAVHLVARATEAEHDRTLAALAGTVTVLLALTRPEAIVVAAPLAIWLFLGRHKSRWSRTALYLFLVAAQYGAFVLWRHSYFGQWQPNTYYAKAAGANFGLVPMGLKYLFRYSNITLLPYLVLITGMVLVRLRAAVPRWWIGLVLTVLFYLAAIVWVGGDHFTLGRFLVPVTPLLLILLAHGMRLARDAINRINPAMAAARLRPATWVFSTLLLLLTILLGMVFHNEGLIFAGQAKQAKQWCAIGNYFAKHYPKDTAIAMIPIGAVGYCSKMPIVDLVGLVEPTIAHAPTDLTRSMAGHGRYDSMYVLEKKKPPLVFAVLDFAPWPLPEWFVRYGAQHLAAKDLLERREFVSDYMFHRVKISPLFFHYWSRREFERPEINPGDYPVPGYKSPVPEREPLSGNSLAEKLWGVRDQPTRPFEIPEGWEEW